MTAGTAGAPPAPTELSAAAGPGLGRNSARPAAASAGAELLRAGRGAPRHGRRVHRNGKRSALPGHSQQPRLPHKSSPFAFNKTVRQTTILTRGDAR